MTKRDLPSDECGPDGRPGPDVDDSRKPDGRKTNPAQRALALLVRREHSRQELSRKLQARGFGEGEAAAAVERMAQAGWQDDRRFACAVARTRAAAGYGPLRIRAELASHGLDSAAIEAAFAALAESGDDDWVARARHQVRRRHGALDRLDLAKQRRVVDFLLRRGFDGDSVRAALRAVSDD